MFRTAPRLAGYVLPLDTFPIVTPPGLRDPLGNGRTPGPWLDRSRSIESIAWSRRFHFYSIANIWDLLALGSCSVRTVSPTTSASSRTTTASASGGRSVD